MHLIRTYQNTQWEAKEEKPESLRSGLDTVVLSGPSGQYILKVTGPQKSYWPEFV